MAKKRSSGQFSLLRVGTFIAIIGFIAVIGGVVSFVLQEASHQSPLQIEPFPGAEPSGERSTGSNTRMLYFRVPHATPEQVAQYYNQKMREHYGTNDEDCVRTPPAGELDISRFPNAVPYEYKCMFDRSGFRSTQYTQVMIQPGMYNSDPALNTEGVTIVAYQQYWQPR